MRNRPLFYREGGSSDPSALRLDAGESYWLKRDLEWVDTQTYMQLYPGLIARSLIPSKAGIPTWAQTHTWREMDSTGKAKIITAMGDDLPRTDVFKKEVTKTIKTVGGAYGYTFDEMQAAASQGGHLDADRAIANRFSVEEQVDEIHAYGAAEFGLEGLLNLSGVAAFTLADKAKGGKSWGTLAAPNATGKEVAYDLMAIASDVVEKSIGRVSSVDIVLTIEAYNYASQKEMSSTDHTKALAAALASPFINSITPWYRCKASYSAGKLANDTMVVYPKNDMYVCAINPMEYTPEPAQLKNLEYTINARAKTGGVVCRYPYLLRKATGFGA